MFKNSKGNIFYGIHFYPGLAQYQEEGQEPYRVFLNEDTLRKMDPTFAGRPIFVEHVDDVDPDIDSLRKEADGWVIESFYNASDGKHWVKFIVVTERADRAIRSGMRLSNAYEPKSFKDGGLWNGVPYAKEITDGVYEHLAIVKNPRYEESVIMTPDEFKLYNEKNVLELKKLSNSKEKGTKMKFSFFKKTKIDNAIDPDLMLVLPKSGKSISLGKLINDAYEKDQDPAMDGNPKNVSGRSDDDAHGEAAQHHAMANPHHMVKMHDGSYMKVKDMMQKHKDMHDELEELKEKKKDSGDKEEKVEDSEEKELDLKVEPRDVDAEGDLHNRERDDDEWDMDEHEEEVEKEEHKMELKDDSLEHPEEPVHDAEDPEEDKQAKKKALQLAEHEEKEIEEAKKDSKKNKKKHNAEAKVKADRLRNAHLRADALENSADNAPVIELSQDMVARGKVRYGS
jgi:hypothetical protein